MEKTKHTPGPWYVTGSCEDGTMITNGGGVSIARWPRNNRWEKPEGIIIGDISDARLIAAAPDLLAACKGIMHQWETGVDVSTYVDINDVRAAIDKAEGREQGKLV